MCSRTTRDTTPGTSDGLAVSRATVSLISVTSKHDLACALRVEGFDVRAEDDVARGVASIRSAPTDVVIIDMGSAHIRAIELCRAIAVSSDSHVIVCGDGLGESERIALLLTGADDVLSHPVSASEVVAHVVVSQRHRRRRETPSSDVRSFAWVSIDRDRRLVRVEDRPVELTRTEFDLLDTLSERPGVVMARDALMRAVWGPNWFGAENVLDTHMSHLRRKIDKPGQPSLIMTVRGIGFRFVDSTDALVATARTA